MRGARREWKGVGMVGGVMGGRGKVEREGSRVNM